MSSPGRLGALALLLWLSLPRSLTAATEIDSWLAAMKQVTPDGRANLAAARAWRQVARLPATELPRILSAMDGASPLAANWLRGAVDAIAERTLAAGGRLPAAGLEQLVRDRSHDPRARQLALQWLARVDLGAADRLVPGMLHDPSIEFRRKAVARLVDQAEPLVQADPTAAAQLYQEALEGARDEDQIGQIARQLRQLGQPVNLPRHFGFLMDWKIIGPFDNTDRKGFDVVYPPEGVVDLSAEYPGKKGPVGWVDFRCDDDGGLVDLNQPYGRQKEVVAYAYTEFTSSGERSAELRLGCKNGWKLWLNGRLIFGRDEYHRRMQMDQYRFPVTLQPGRNQILLKVCQNEEVESWTVEWQFQIRVCDAVGTAILSTSRPPGR
jgi:hypothetical protein